MICEECLVDYCEKDFILNSCTCYHCIYRKKLKLITLEKKSEMLECKACGQYFFIDKSKKIRQRNVYCSKKCAQAAHREQVQNFWTNKINCRFHLR